MKVLVSAYACEPNKGSEPGVGWNWALEIARLGHMVWVVTRANNRQSIDAQRIGLPERNNIHFLYYDLPMWACWWKKGKRGIYLYYFLWQIGAYRLAKKIHSEVKFNLVHHITFVNVRLPSFMGNLSIPFIFGPAGGGEKAPWKLRNGFGLRGWILDFLRDIANTIVRIDPFALKTFKQADRIYVTSEQTRDILPQRYQKKTQVRLAIGINGPKTTFKRKSNSAFRILYVGRFIYWKGMKLGIHSFARVLEIIPNSMLTMIGKGPEETDWKNLANKLCITKKINWIPWVENFNLVKFYPLHDVLLFPSLHDSGGVVVLEAMAHGLPVVCLDIGGPSTIVNNSCGLKVPISGIGKIKVIELLSEALVRLGQDPSLRAKLSFGALNRKEEFTWRSVVNSIYS